MDLSEREIGGEVERGELFKQERKQRREKEQWKKKRDEKNLQRNYREREIFGRERKKAKPNFFFI